MKKVFVTFAVLILLCVPLISFAAENDASPVTVPDKTMVIDQQEEDYALPYPGLLPDNPLYFLKTARDKLISSLISDPRKKADFDILQSDKRLQAGVSLIDKSKKYELAEQTVSKGQNYFDEAIQKTRQAKQEGMDTNDLESKLLHSAKKHVSVIASIVKNAPEDKKKIFDALAKRVIKTEDQVDVVIKEDKTK